MITEAMEKGNEPLNFDPYIIDSEIHLAGNYSNTHMSATILDDKVTHGDATVNHNDTVYICGGKLNILHNTGPNSWGWDNKSFDSKCNPDVTEEKVRKIIDSLVDMADCYVGKVFYYTALEMFENAKDKGNYR